MKHHNSKRFLDDLYEATRRSQRIKEAIRELFGVTTDDWYTSSCAIKLVRAKGMLAWILVHKSGYSNSVVSSVCGWQSKCSAPRGMKAIEDDDTLRAEAERLFAEVGIDR